MEYSETYSLISPGCGCCSFAVPTHVKKAWLANHSIWWHCPSCGRKLHFIGETETDKLRRQLESKAREVAAERGRAKELARRYTRIRDRVKNGVCPCCNRSFENLLRHMQTKHPGFGTDKTLRAMREAVGLTQVELAAEIGVSAALISRAENNRPVSDSVKNEVDAWLAQFAAAS